MVIGMKMFLSMILGPVMIRTEHDMLTKFLKMKHLIFVGFKTVDALVCIVDYYER